MSDRIFLHAAFFVALLVSALTGCAPAAFDRALAYYADQERVTDAAARRTTAAWYLRFNAELIHEMNTAIADTDESRGRASGESTLRRAGDLASKSIRGEIERLSPTTRDELARRANCAAGTDILIAEFEMRQKSALASELESLRRLPRSDWVRQMNQIARGIEPIADDRDRLTRQMLLAGLSPVVSAGIQKQESQLRASIRDRRTQPIDRAAIWNPDASTGDARTRWAPIIAIVWPASRDYPDDFDRIGAVALSGTREKIMVSIDPRQPYIYAYSSSALVQGRHCPQFSYVWWFSDRPPMSTDDAAAGHIDGGTLRLTLDQASRPAFAEIILNCGCGHEVYVADDIEIAAQREFGAPLPDARFSVELRSTGHRPVLVAGTFDRGNENGRPIVVLAPGTHEPIRFAFEPGPANVVREFAESHRVGLRDYDDLDRLPLDDGVASMFGPDGLVHFAGRKEGFLLAPTGMLSAGQPRKRGTQRVRWDEYLFDDPTLLEHTLRLPHAF
jgi:hypothetical protein